MNQSPPGLIVLPGTTPERTDSVLISLLRKQHTLKGKKIAVLGEHHQSERREGAASFRG